MLHDQRGGGWFVVIIVEHLQYLRKPSNPLNIPKYLQKNKNHYVQSIHASHQS